MSDTIETVETEVVVTRSGFVADDDGWQFVAYAKVGGEMSCYAYGATAEVAATKLAGVLVEALAAKGAS